MWRFRSGRTRFPPMDGLLIAQWFIQKLAGSEEEMGKKSKGEKKNDAVKANPVSKDQLKAIDELFAAAKKKKQEAAASAKEPTSSAKRKISEDDVEDQVNNDENIVLDGKKKRSRLRAPAEPNSSDQPGTYGVIKSTKWSIPVKIISPEAPLERIDAETGLPVYKAHILKVGEGGGTALCPFDCDCCF